MIGVEALRDQRSQLKYLFGSVDEFTEEDRKKISRTAFRVGSESVFIPDKEPDFDALRIAIYFDSMSVICWGYYRLGLLRVEDFATAASVLKMIQTLERIKCEAQEP